MNTTRTDSDDRAYPLPEQCQHIRFEGSDCVVMAPEDYEELYKHARKLETELTAKTAELEVWRKCDRIMDGYPPATDEPLYVQLERMIKYIDELHSKLRETRAAALEEAAEIVRSRLIHAHGDSLANREIQTQWEILRAKAASVRNTSKQ